MKNNETGRSMVEMLGVLAIIGVLSVAGIAGYTMAMRAYRANEILQGASMLYAIGRSQNGGSPGAGSQLTYANGIGGTIPGNAQSITYNQPDTAAGINTVTIVTQAGDCEAVRNKVGNAGAISASACDGNTVVLTYSNN